MTAQTPVPKLFMPRVVITPGEPAGVGPELVARIAQEVWPCELIAIADPDLMQKRVNALGLDLEIEEFQPGKARGKLRSGVLSVLPVPLVNPSQCGRLDKENAGYVLKTLKLAANGCESGLFDALVTGPVHKGVIRDAGIEFTGHTEFLAELSRRPRVVMMLAGGSLRVALVTTHLALRDVPAAVTRQTVLNTIKITHQDLKDRLGLAAPRLMVLGLNPHAGEGGHFGNEESAAIQPAIEDAQRLGIAAFGPVSADTAFVPAQLKLADCIVAMYHDQALPVLKYASFGHAVNVTLGLPYVRTSVDHGTALDIAGLGQASADSLRAATRLAIELAGVRKPRSK